MKRTPWFRPEDKPAYPGLYETTLKGTAVWVDFWDGKVWRWTVNGNEHSGYMHRIMYWRGLAEPPK